MDLYIDIRTFIRYDREKKKKYKSKIMALVI